MLNAAEKSELIRIVKDAVRRGVEGRRADFPLKRRTATNAFPHLDERAGVFVTIYRRGDLRGCIGFITSDEPLSETVEEVAIRSALDDPRFPPVAPEELDELTVEISVLSPMKEVRDIGEIEVGAHGLMIQLGTYRGLLLPQVATQQGWDREEFLDETCVKAGLPRGSWRKPGTKIYRFSAEIVEEIHD